MLNFAVLVGALSAQYLVNDKQVGVQLFQWRFKDIADECVNFLGPNGYSFVQTSPVQEHAGQSQEGNIYPWYLAYQPLGYSIGNRLGSLKDFKDMVKTCTGAGVDIVVDVVLNHNSYINGNSSVGFGYDASLGPWSAPAYHESFPSPRYTAEHYHDSQCNGDIDWGNLTSIYFCRLATLVDLKTEHPFVRQSIVDFLNELLSYGVAGFRTDAAKSIPFADWQAIMDKLQNNYHGKRPYFAQEIMYTFPDGTYLDYHKLGRILNFDYGQAVGKLFRNINGGSTDDLPDTLNNLALNQSDYSLVFTENHDKERYATLTVRDQDGDANFALYRINRGWWYKQATAFTLLYPFGIPQIHSGYKFQFNGGTDAQRESPVTPPSDSHGYVSAVSDTLSSWTLQHRLTDIYPLVRVRNYISDGLAQLPYLYSDVQNQIYWAVPGKGFFVINSAQGNTPNQNMNQTLQTYLPEGTYCNMVYAYAKEGKCVLWPGVKIANETIQYTVNADGLTTIVINSNDQSRVVAIYTGNDGLLSASFSATTQAPSSTSIGTATAGISSTSAPIQHKCGVVVPQTLVVATTDSVTSTSLIPAVTTTHHLPTPTPQIVNSVLFQIKHHTGFGDNVYVVGSFNNWDTCNAVSCQWSAGDLWHCNRVRVTPGVTYQWKAISYGSFSQTTCSKPQWQPGTDNNQFVAAAGTQIISYAYEFPTPTTTPAPTSTSNSFVQLKITHHVDFGQSLYAVGEFNGWNVCGAVKCTWSAGDVWVCDNIATTPGQTYQWKSVVYSDCTKPDWQPGNNNVFTATDGLEVVTFSY
ncbi:Alpha-amylase 1 [Boothiomyces macroporosus]|uniref:Alpha-amylase n=1 Tax=Boothiomyces macroporosus TaxID=261099 RepID=A0AAD5YA66_9FUNG|nr:Alpha-amylase 1 [Boothiomyces macroporosus]